MSIKTSKMTFEGQPENVIFFARTRGAYSTTFDKQRTFLINKTILSKVLNTIDTILKINIKYIK